MPGTHADLDAMQAAYHEAVETWIAAIRDEEALASVAHNVAEIDLWEAAHFREDEIRHPYRYPLAGKRIQREAAGDEQFDWSWVDRAAQTITSAGLKWRPVLAFHACGTNVGDTCNVPLASISPSAAANVVQVSVSTGSRAKAAAVVVSFASEAGAKRCASLSP